MRVDMFGCVCLLKLRETLLEILIDTVKEAPPKTPEVVHVIAKALAALVQKGTELNTSAQVLCFDLHPEQKITL